MRLIICDHPKVVQNIPFISADPLLPLKGIMTLFGTKILVPPRVASYEINV
jgi:hypothetical protein